MKASEARRIANGYNRKKHRKYMIGQYKSIHKCIKQAAKRGENYISFSPSKYRYDAGLDVPFRLFKIKNPEFTMSINESYGESINITIKW